MSRQGGSVTIEVVLLTPVLLALLGLVVMTGRVGEARGAVIHAAEQAARAASIVGDPAQARDKAHVVAYANLEAQDVVCRDLMVEVDTSRFARGSEVAVTVTCAVDLSAVAFAGLPGSRTVSAEAVEVIDVYRGGP